VVREIRSLEATIVLAAAARVGAARRRRPWRRRRDAGSGAGEVRACAGGKFLAYLGPDGYPDIAPALSLTPAGDRALVFAGAVDGLEPGAQVAATILTAEPLAYQVKGRFLGTERSLGAPLGVIQVLEVYSASPPLPGERIA
jgi:hypothetical protein